MHHILVRVCTLLLILPHTCIFVHEIRFNYVERGVYHIYVKMMLGRHDESIILAKDRIARIQTTQNTENTH